MSSKPLYAHQVRFLEKKVSRGVLVWSTGAAKSRAACEWSKEWGGKTLFVVPKALPKKWERELLEWGATGTIVTKEFFRSNWEKLPGFDNIVVDELHHFLSGLFKSAMSKSLRNFLKKNEAIRFLGLTATPRTADPWSVYTLASLLGKKMNYFQFKQRFFFDMRMGARIISVPKKGKDSELGSIVRKIADVVDINECADIPEQVFETEWFELNDEQKKIIKENYDSSPIVRFTKQHQIENGVLKGDDFGLVETQYFQCEKTNRIKELCLEENKVAVICRYNAQIDMLVSMLASLKKDIYVIRGDVKDRDTVVKNVEASNSCIVLIQADCGEGYELPSIGLILFASKSFKYLSYKQIVGRFLRLNKLKKNVYIHLNTSGGIDEAVHDAIMRGEDFDAALYDR